MSTSTTECAAGRCLVTLASGREHIWPGIAVDDASVSWTEHPSWIPYIPGDAYDGRVTKVPVGGGAATTLASKQVFPSYIRVDATSVFWTTLGTLANEHKDAVIKLPPQVALPALSVRPSRALW